MLTMISGTRLDKQFMQISSLDGARVPHQTAQNWSTNPIAGFSMSVGAL